MNSARDFLKHGTGGKEASFDFEEEARELIDRALSNLFLLSQTETPTMSRFRSNASRGVSNRRLERS
jgi:hypothetical protein